MENKIIYVPVSVQDELPPSNGDEEYMCWNAKGEGLYGMYFAERNQCDDGSIYIDNVTTWLKKIELPSEEEIFNKSYEECDMASRSSFKKGANYILSIINQKK